MYVKRFLEKDEQSDLECDWKRVKYNFEKAAEESSYKGSPLPTSQESSIVRDICSSNSLVNGESKQTENADCVKFENFELPVRRPFTCSKNINNLDIDAGASASLLSINSALKNWALSQNVNHKQINTLLIILKPYHIDLPLDSRTLLGTARVLNMFTKRYRSGVHIFRYTGNSTTPFVK